mgnify:CR=1 FL=1
MRPLAIVSELSAVNHADGPAVLLVFSFEGLSFHLPPSGVRDEHSRKKHVINQLRDAYGIESRDVAAIQALGNRLKPKVPSFVNAFYVWLRTRPEYLEYFSDPARQARASKLQEQYWIDFLTCNLDESYLARRRKVGEVHAHIGLGLSVYFAAMHFSLEWFVDVSPVGADSEDHAASVRSITKLMHLDTAVVVETYSRLVNEKIADQNRAMMEMSTPITSIWQGILLLPLVGIIDSRRAHDLMTSMLTKIAETRSKIFILDISGVAVVDTAVANHLIKITKATHLMGCECIISGISPAIATTVVELGVEVGDIKTTATLRDALEEAFRQTGVELQTAHSHDE